ncbi:MAG: deoxyribonuclease IV [Patescibacteria group bacterium]|nr:deoxyribonuclease IV [Patescibacteria group bacterium]
MPKVGAHVSAAGSLDLSFERAQEIGAEATQIFISPPQQWLHSNHTEEEIARYKDQANKTRIEPNFIHAAYLINLASPNPELVKKSIDWLIYSQKVAEKLWAEGTIFHIGSFKDTTEEQALKQVIEAIKTIIKSTGNVTLILENSAGAGNLIGDQFSELGKIIRQVNDPRLKVCLDTQHAFASGYDFRTKEGLKKTLAEFDREVGLANLVAIHANDSKVEFGSHRDRHENIGEGFIGLEGFKNLINHPALQNIPFILEVPGFDNNGPDKNNVQLLKSLSC